MTTTETDPVEARLAAIEATLPHLATKADLERLRADITKRMVGIMATTLGAMVALSFLVARLTGG